VIYLLISGFDLPASENIERLAVHDEDAGRSIGAILAATTKGADVNAGGWEARLRDFAANMRLRPVK
jgi:hypothetical protein